MLKGDTLGYAYLAARYRGRTEQASGSLIHIRKAQAAPIESLIIDAWPPQSGTGDPTPENVRDFSGITSVTLYVSPTPDPDDATTYTLDWTDEGENYGVYIDALTGAAVADKTVNTYSDKTGFGVLAGAPAWFHWITPGVASADRAKLSLCNQAVFRTGNPVGPYFTLRKGGTGDYFELSKMDESESLDDLDTRFGDNPLEICYSSGTIDLEDPDFEITPIAPLTLAGENYIWVDNGFLTCTYKSAI